MMFINRVSVCLKEGMITTVMSVARSLLHVQSSTSICTNIEVHGSDVMCVGGRMYARMHFVHIEGFTQGSDLFSVHSARNPSTWYPAFVFTNRYFHMYGRHVSKQRVLSRI
jgi:hypothetical protein